MNFLNHYKTSMPEDTNILNLLSYSVGLFIPNIIFFFPFHKYDLAKNRINKLIRLAEKNRFTIIKAFLVGMTNHYIGDSFSYENRLSNILERESYMKNFSREINYLKNKEIDNEITRTVNNYFNVNAIFESIDKIYQVYSYMSDSKLEENKRILYDYLIINRLTNKIYSSIVFF